MPKKIKYLQPGDFVIYKNTGDLAKVKSQINKRQVIILLDKNTEAFKHDFAYINWLILHTQAFPDADLKLPPLTPHDILELTVALDMLEVLPDRELINLLYN